MIKKILNIIVVFLLITLSINLSYAKIYSVGDITKIYDKFIVKVELKFSKEKEITLLEKLDKKLKYIIDYKKLSPNNEIIIYTLDELNSDYLLKLKSLSVVKKDSNLIKDSKVKSVNNTIYDKQKILEKSIRNQMSEKSKIFIISSNITKLIKKGKKFYYTNNKYEIVDNGVIKKINFSKYFSINSENYNYFLNKKGIIIYSKAIGYVFLDDYTFEEKIAYSDGDKFLKSVISENKNYILENSIYYSYKFTNYSHIKDDYGFYMNELPKYGFNKNITILYIDGSNKYNFVNKYSKIELIGEKFLSGVVNKDLFLKILSSDKVYVNNESHNDLLRIKALSKKLTKNLSKEKKIEKIYGWILRNINYSKNFKLTDYKIFSGIETYKNKSGVCEGYAKLMVYMLLFSGIDDVESIKGYVIDAPDFPEIGHAWLRIGDKYYDPTFDDPIGLIKARKIEEYKYFGLPKDLFYTNRYEYKDIPDYIKKLSLEKREELIYDNLNKLTSKYLNSGYLLMNPFIFRYENNLGSKKILNIGDFKKIMKYYDVDNYKFIDKNGERKSITSIVYYTVDDNNIENIVNNYFNYDIKNTFLFKWKIGNSGYEYRIAKEIKIK